MARKKAAPLVVPQILQKISISSKKLDKKQLALLSKALDDDTKIIFINGPAGSSKTYMAVYAALRLLQSDEERDLLYVRTIIESADKGLGALPGDLKEKFNPYMAPLNDKLDEMLPSNTTLKRELIDKGRVSAMPINFLRGANWVNKVVVADEAQNFSFKELMTLITRLGEGSRLFICGDTMQSDINGKSGFTDMARLFKDDESRKRGIVSFEFDETDIKRSRLLKYIITKLNYYIKSCK